MAVRICLVSTGCARYSLLTSLPPDYQIRFLVLHLLIKAHLLIKLNLSQIKSNLSFLILQGRISLVSFHFNLALVSHYQEPDVSGPCVFECRYHVIISFHTYHFASSVLITAACV